MTHTTKFIGIGMLGLALAAGVTLTAGSALGQGRSEARGRQAEVRTGSDAHEARGGRHHDLRPRWLRARARARAFARELNLTDEQRELARNEAQALRPAARALRDEARAIVEGARARIAAGDREGAREEARTKLLELRQRARTEFAPHGRAVLDSLSPEQRTRIESRLAEHGRTFDVEEASRRLGRRWATGQGGGRGRRGPSGR